MNIKIQLRSNHFRKWLRRLGCSLLIGSMLCTQTVPAWATSKAEKEKKEAQQKLDDAKKKAEAAEANKKAANAQVSKLTSDFCGASYRYSVPRDGYRQQGSRHQAGGNRLRGS